MGDLRKSCGSFYYNARYRNFETKSAVYTSFSCAIAFGIAGIPGTLIGLIIGIVMLIYIFREPKNNFLIHIWNWLWEKDTKNEEKIKKSNLLGEVNTTKFMYIQLVV